jgi:hypothetical protein
MSRSETHGHSVVPEEDDAADDGAESHCFDCQDPFSRFRGGRSLVLEGDSLIVKRTPDMPGENPYTPWNTAGKIWTSLLACKLEKYQEVVTKEPYM